MIAALRSKLAGRGGVPSPFPKAIAPESVDFPLYSAAESIAARDDARWLIGADENGDVLSPKIDGDTPNVLVSAGYGGGKTVFCRTMIESLRVGTDSHPGGAQAWQVLIADGDRGEYVDLESTSSIQLVSSSPAQHLALVHYAHTVMDERLRTANCGKDAPPILLVLDDFSRILRDLSRVEGGERRLVHDLGELLSGAHRANMAVLIACNASDIDVIPTKWYADLPLAVAIGWWPERLMNSTLFDGANVRAEAFHVLGAIPHQVRGRGVAIVRDDEETPVTEVQGFIGYSPGAVWPRDGEPRERWKEAENAAYRARDLYPHLTIRTEPLYRSDADADTILANTTVVER